MDAPRGLNEPDADKALRTLFKEAGGFLAPEGLDARILQRIAVSPRPAIVPEKPLLPKWTWLVAAALVLGIGLTPIKSASASCGAWARDISTSRRVRKQR